MERWVAAQCLCLCQAFTIMDQNRDGFIDKEDLRDTFAALGGYRISGVFQGGKSEQDSAAYFKTF